ncbi:MAG: hypothetical protein ACW96X_04490, partial [Promethearchaeota archaeon]
MVFRILRPDSNIIWQNKEILKRFSRYRGIIDGKQLARYLIAKTIECDYNSSDSIEKLEILLKEKSKEFNELLKKDIEEIRSRRISSNSYIHLVEILAIKYLEKCIFCERKCKVNRIDGQKGFCL